MRSSGDDYLSRLFLIVGAPPERDKTVVLRVLSYQDSLEMAMATFRAGDDVPQEPNWVIRAIPIYPAEDLDRAIAQFYIDSGQPPGPGVINPLVREFRQNVAETFLKSVADHIDREPGAVPLAASKWGKK